MTIPTVPNPRRPWQAPTIARIDLAAAKAGPNPVRNEGSFGQAS